MRRRGRPMPDLVLTDDERMTLAQWTRRRTTAQARHRAREFRRFLNTIDANVPADLDAHVILDNYGTH